MARNDILCRPKDKWVNLSAFTEVLELSIQRVHKFHVFVSYMSIFILCNFMIFKLQFVITVLSTENNVFSHVADLRVYCLSTTHTF